MARHVEEELRETNLAALSDRELSGEYCRTGDSRCFEELFDRYRNKIHAACLRFFHGNSGMADDATQETFARALDKIEHADVENIGAWLYAIARNCCIDTHRREHRMLYEKSESGRIDVPCSEDPEQKLWVQQMREKINELKDRQRISIKLYLQGFSYQEISRLTHYSMKEVKSALQTAKENIRKYLLKEGHGRQYA